MSVSITIRSVPDGVRDELAARAARSGKSLQEYLLAELTHLTDKPSLNDAIAEIRRRAAHFPLLDPDEVLAVLHESRDDH